MVIMLVGEQDDIGLGQGQVVRHLAEGINMDGLAGKGEHQTAVTDKGDRQIPGRGFDGIRSKLFLGRGSEWARQDEEHYQGKYSTHDQTSLPMRLWN